MMGRCGLNGMELGLPSSAQLQDGRWVSGYNQLPDDVLAFEGWKPVQEGRPDYDPITQTLVQDTVEDAADAILITYRVDALPVDPVQAELLELRAQKEKFAASFKPTALKSEIVALCNDYIQEP